MNKEQYLQEFKKLTEEMYAITKAKNVKRVWVNGYEGRYSIDNHGLVFSHRNRYGPVKPRLKKPIKMVVGYYQVSLWKKNKEDRRYLHRLIAEHFIPNPEHKPHVNHKNGDKLDNRLENLEWCTQRENNLHAIETGLMPGKFKFEHIPQSEKHHLTVLTKEDVWDIRNNRSDMTNVALGHLYGVTGTTIGNIKKRKTWKHV